MRLRKTIVAMTAMFALAALADVAVTDVVAKQRYPWNGLVDITCKVTGIEGTTNGLKFVAAAVMPDTGKARRVSHFWVVQGGTNSTDRAVHVNGDYRLLWDAKVDLGIVRYTNMVVRITVVDHEMVQLWEGGPYWATTNIGAEEPWEYGYYFWWGDTVGYKREDNAWVATDGSSSNFQFNDPISLQTYDKNIATLQSEGWIVSQDGTYVLAPEYDVAQVQWGGGWRMPTDAEFSALISNCITTWTTQNGVYGRLVTGKGAYADRSIFLPAAGLGYGSYFNYAGSNGNYWSSTPNSDYSYGAWDFYFNSSNFGRSYNGRYYGFSVRPVRGFAE